MMSARRAIFNAIAGLLLLCAAAAVLPLKASAAATVGRGPTQREWGTCASGMDSPSNEWFFAEGCTNSGFETWILVGNPSTSEAAIQIDYLTDQGPFQGPRDIVPPGTRKTYNVADHVVSTEVSTRVSSSVGVVCERAMYGNDREWGTDSIGLKETSRTWYLAEGCTDGGIETWVLVQNPTELPASIDMKLQTSSGERQGPRDTVPPMSRRTYDLADFVVSYDVSTRVVASADVVCERAMYGGGRAWATASSGSTEPSRECFLAEGCTLQGFETWLLVQNPGDEPASIRTTLLSGDGRSAGPAEAIGAGCRRSYRLSDYLDSASIAASVSSDKPVVVERAMYGDDRRWGTCSAGTTSLERTWYLAEGCTEEGFETWLALMNPSDSPVDVNVTLLTERGAAQGPRARIEPWQRATFDLADWVTSFEVSAVVEASAPLSCERAMYGNGTGTGMCAPVAGPVLYPFTREGSIACGHWPEGSDDYPYFGAPRNGTRLHAGIDIYPPAGNGAPVIAMKDGTIVKTGLFYTRYTGEETFAVLVDHGDFVANYAELQPLEGWVQPGARVARGAALGRVSGTVQLHFEMYAPGTTSWLWWYGPQPADLLDPTATMLELY